MTTTGPRRELLLQAASELFSARGYHAVGIDDIGEAAGITGPGVYRHFPSKQALLQALCDMATARLLEAAREAQTLERVVDLHTRFVVRDRQLIRVYLREQWALAKDAQRAFAAQRRNYEQVWRDALTPRRPDLGPDEVALVVSTVIGMLNNSTLIESPLSGEERKATLDRLALSALLGE